jgi:nicotinate-nucleotide adenylyltransferase
MILADEAFVQLRLDRLLWVLTPDPPHKQNQEISPATQRLELVQAAIGDNPHFELSRVELDRPGPHYAVDTVKLMEAQYPQSEIYYLIGGDSLHDLVTWSRPRELVERVAGLGIMRRPGIEIEMGEIEKALPGITGKVVFIDTPLIEIASHEIRERIAGGMPYRYYVHPAVYELIRERQYYK